MSDERNEKETPVFVTLLIFGILFFIGITWLKSNDTLDFGRRIHEAWDDLGDLLLGGGVLVGIWWIKSLFTK